MSKRLLTRWTRLSFLLCLGFFAVFSFASREARGAAGGEAGEVRMDSTSKHSSVAPTQRRIETRLRVLEGLSSTVVGTRCATTPTSESFVRLVTRS